MRTMRYGQYVIAVVLTVICLIRAIIDGAEPVLVFSMSGCFAAWYILGSFLAPRVVGDRLSTVWLVGLAALWFGLATVSMEFIWLAFPIWLLAGQLLDLRPAIILSVLVFAAVVLVPLVQTGNTSYAFVTGPLVGGVFALGISRGYLQLLLHARERQSLISSLVKTQDELARAQRESGAIEERTRLSRDIHDTIAQGLSAIVLITRAGSGKKLMDAKNALTHIETIALDGLVDVRRIVNALSPAELQQGALANALRRMLHRLTAETGIRTEFHADDSSTSLPAMAEIVFLRMAQSALSNVRLHADAHHVVVTLDDSEGTARLDIVDDGRGFDVRRWSDTTESTPSGYGLDSMRARLRELGGGLDIESAEGSGTALSAHVPLSQLIRRENGDTSCL